MILAFGPFRLDTGEKSIFREGKALAITPKEYEVLHYLVERAGRLVTKEEILAAVWPDTIVEESNLSVQISSLRKLLGESTSQRSYIETVPRRGYRFIAEVEKSVETGATPVETSDDRGLGRDGEGNGHSSHWQTAWMVLAGFVAMFALLLIAIRSAAPGRWTMADWKPLPLTTSPGIETSPALSPDGTQVIYSILTPRENVGLWLRKTEGGEPVRLTHDFDYNAAWSPDGREIAFIRFNDDQIFLMLRPSFGGEDRTLKKLDYYGALPGPIVSYTADGKWVLTNQGVGSQTGAQPRRLVAISTETGEQKELLEPVLGSSGDSAPILSAKGDRLVFCRCASVTACDLYAVKIKDLKPTGKPERLTWFPSPEFRAVYLQDESLLYSLGPPDGRSLYRLYFDWFGRPRSYQISPTGEDILFPTVATTAGGETRLVYVRNEMDLNLQKLELESPDGRITKPELFAASTRSEETPAFSPDGSKVAFASMRSGSWEIWVCALAGDGDKCSQLTHSGPAYSRSPAWSADGKWIAFDSRPSGNAQLFLMAAAGGSAKALTFGPEASLEPCWSPDGQWLYFASNRSGRFEIYRSRAQEVIAGRIGYEAMTTEGGSSPRLSPDGNTILYRGPRGVFLRLSLEDRKTHALPNFTFIAPPIPGPGTLSYGFHASRQQGFLARADWATEKLETLLPVSLNRPTGLARSPDGKTILYVQADRSDSDLMVVDPFHY